MVSNSKIQIFVDTSFFKALIDEKDDFHTQGVQIFENVQRENLLLVTTNYVLDETYTLIRKRRGREKVRELRDFLVKIAPQIRITRVTSADDASAWEWFLKDWSDLSFTDCVSFAVMERLSLTRVAAFDDHFSRAGFELES